MPLVGLAFAALVVIGLVALAFAPAPLRARVGQIARRPVAIVAAGTLATAMGVLAMDRSEPPDRRPNIIVVMVDDLDLGLFNDLATAVRPEGAPPSLTSQIGANGATFANSFVVDPLCCPSRVSFLRGQYPHNHGVWQNVPPAGGFESFHAAVEAETLAVWLQASGYRTGLIGKYINGYGDDVLPPLEDRPPLEVPPGWDANSFRALWGTPSYVKFRMNEGGRLVGRADDPEDYQTTVLSRMAVNIVGIRDPRPFFLFITPLAPHDGFPDDDLGLLRDGVSEIPVPAPEWAAAFDGIPMTVADSVLEDDLSDKPRWVQSVATLWQLGLTQEELLERLRSNYEARIEAMLSVEALVANLVDVLGEDAMRNTYLFFTSDNGYHLGEHGLPPDKRTPYEEDIRVPLLVMGPRITPGTVRPELVTNLDLTATILDIANVTPPVAQDGRSLLPLLRAQTVFDWRRAFMIEYRGAEEDPVPSWLGLRTTDYKYVEWPDGFVELYDLHDLAGLEMRNLAELRPELVTQLAALLDSLQACAGPACEVGPTNSLAPAPSLSLSTGSPLPSATPAPSVSSP